MLSQDSRRKVLSMANELELSPNTVKYRINNLLKSKILVAFRPKINEAQLGFQHYKVFIYMNNVDRQSKMCLTEFLKTKLNVVYVTEAIGGADLEFEAFVTNSLELNQIIKEMRINFPNLICDYETTVINKTIILPFVP
jgi:DNA-binding Lrp family transcriptional regulator